MTDDQYILEGVILANGWAFDKKRTTLTTPGGYFGLLSDQEIRYALAGQLASQVSKPYGLWVYPLGASISSMDVEDARELAKATGDDRAMNTIRVIVMASQISAKFFVGLTR